MHAGLLPNGNFELGPTSSQLRGTEVIGRNAIPRWEISGTVEYIPWGHKQGDMLLVVPEGSYAVRLGNEASIKQRIEVRNGVRYSLTFSAARTCAQEERLNVSVAPESGVLPMQTMYSSNGWDSYAWAWNARSDVAEIAIHNPGVEEDPACGPLIDSVAVKELHPPRRTNSKAPPPAPSKLYPTSRGRAPHEPQLLIDSIYQTLISMHHHKNERRDLAPPRDVGYTFSQSEDQLYLIHVNRYILDYTYIYTQVAIMESICS